MFFKKVMEQKFMAIGLEDWVFVDQSFILVLLGHLISIESEFAGVVFSIQKNDDFW